MTKEGISGKHDKGKYVGKYHNDRAKQAADLVLSDGEKYIRARQIMRHPEDYSIDTVILAQQFISLYLENG